MSPKSDQSALARLAFAHPDEFMAEAGRAKPLYEISNKKLVLNHLSDVTRNTMGRAIMLAVLLDQMTSGEMLVDPATHRRAVESFEEVFNILAGTST